MRNKKPGAVILHELEQKIFEHHEALSTDSIKELEDLFLFSHKNKPMFFLIIREIDFIHDETIGFSGALYDIDKNKLITKGDENYQEAFEMLPDISKVNWDGANIYHKQYVEYMVSIKRYAIQYIEQHGKLELNEKIAYEATLHSIAKMHSESFANIYRYFVGKE